jgi:NTE family protein
MGRSALVLSGGGAKGAAQAGMVLRLAEQGLNPDALFGVSVGALNSAFLSQHGDLLAGAHALRDIWFSINTRSVYRHHSALLRFVLSAFKHSVYDASPLRNLIAQHFDPAKVVKHLGVGYVDLESGLYHLMSGEDPSIREGVFSSASYPVMLSPGKVDGHMCTDGGVTHVTPLKAAIDWGATDITVITLDPPGLEAWSPAKTAWWKPKLHTVLMRMLDIMIDNVIEADLAAAHKVNMRVAEGRGDPDHRHINFTVIRPSVAVEIDSLDFNPERIRHIFSKGYEGGY